VQKARAEEVKAEDSYWKLSHSKIEIVSVETNQVDSESASGSEASPEASASPDSTADPDQLGVNLSSPTAGSKAAEATSKATQATVEAIVSEKADFYSGGQLDSNTSYDSTVRVRYDLVRQDDQWRIQDMAVLE